MYVKLCKFVCVLLCQHVRSWQSTVGIQAACSFCSLQALQRFATCPLHQRPAETSETSETGTCLSSNGRAQRTTPGDLKSLRLSLKLSLKSSIVFNCQIQWRNDKECLEQMQEMQIESNLTTKKCTVCKVHKEQRAALANGMNWMNINRNETTWKSSATCVELLTMKLPTISKSQPPLENENGMRPGQVTIANAIPSVSKHARAG